MQVDYEQKLQSKHGLHNAGNVDLKAWVNWIGMAINTITLMLRSFVTKHCFSNSKKMSRGILRIMLNIWDGAFSENS